MRNCLSIGFVFLLVLSLPAMAVGTAAGAPAATSTATEAPSATAASDASPTTVERELAHLTTAQRSESIVQSLELHQRPDEPGVFGATATVSVPDPVTALELSVPSEATVESAEGFAVVDERTVEWDGETESPTVTLAVEANRRYQRGEHRARSSAQHGDELDFVETGEWGIVAVPQFSYGWEYERGHSISVERSVSVAGEGAVGETIAVFGPVQEYVSDDGDEPHRLVVPEAADLTESPADILAALADASTALDVGAPNDEFFVVAAPTGEVDWRASGLQYGADDAWVRDDAVLEKPGNVWLHEYAHSRQPFAGVGDGTTDATRWLVEGQADYYAATLSLEFGFVEYDTYRRFLERGDRSPYDSGVLADPDTWADTKTPYARGPLALAAIDREIRRATNGDRTLQGVFRRVNRAERPVRLADFYAAVEAVGGSDARTAAERYVETESIPDTWSEREHRTHFDVTQTAFAFGFADEPVAVSGTYRAGQLADLSDLVPGETAGVPVAVENVDDQRGYYDAVLAVDGDVADAVAGSLQAGERTTETLEWTPDEPGTYELRIGDEHRTVTVDPPAEATITALRVSDRSVGRGEAVTARATVEGHPDRPTTTEVVIRTPEGVVSEETVHLGPGETTTVEATFSLNRAGRNQVTAGDQRAFVGVGTVAGAVVEIEGALRSLSTTAAVGIGVLAIGLGGALVARRRGAL